MVDSLPITEVAQSIVKLATLQYCNGTRSSNTVIGIFIGSDPEVASTVARTMVHTVDELPEWIRPTYRRKVSSLLDFGSGLVVKYIRSVGEAKGTTFNHLFVPDQLSNDEKTKMWFITSHVPESNISTYHV